MSSTDERSGRLFLAVDIGGTKVQASLATEGGEILASKRCRTPRGKEATPESITGVVEKALKKVLKESDTSIKDVAAIGIAVPGVVEHETGCVVVTPNTSLSGDSIGPDLQREFGLPVAVGNDANFGALGEKWLGAGRDAESAVGIFVGTGIGAGIVQGDDLLCGARDAAAEIGHMVMQIGGPKCGCGNLGCFEALAGRTAIERDIRKAIKDGRETILKELLQEGFTVIRSGMLRRALEAEDELVTEVMTRASEVIGYACLSVRHLIDPEVIIIGGGVAEACGDFMMPIIKRIVKADNLPGARKSRGVVISELGDDAVVLGCVAAAKLLADKNPKAKPKGSSPKLVWVEFGKITVDGEACDYDIYVTAKGKVKKRDKSLAKQEYGSSHTIGPDELEKVVKGNPAVVFVGIGTSGMAKVNDKALKYLREQGIRCVALPSPDAVAAFNESEERKAALIHVTC